MYMYTCMCIYIYIYTCILIYLFTHMEDIENTCIYLSSYLSRFSLFLYIYIYTYICISVYVYIYIYIRKQYIIHVCILIFCKDMHRYVVHAFWVPEDFTTAGPTSECGNHDSISWASQSWIEMFNSMESWSSHSDVRPTALKSPKGVSLGTYVYAHF